MFELHLGHNLSDIFTISLQDAHSHASPWSNFNSSLAHAIVSHELYFGQFSSHQSKERGSLYAAQYKVSSLAKIVFAKKI